MRTLAGGVIGERSVLAEGPVKQIRMNAAASRLAIGHANEIVVVDFSAAGDSTTMVGRVPIVCQDFCLSPSGRYLATFEKLSREAVPAGRLLLLHRCAC